MKTELELPERHYRTTFYFSVFLGKDSFMFTRAKLAAMQ